MPDNTPTEEQEQFKQLIKRWRKFSMLYMVALGMIGLEYAKRKFAKELTEEEYALLFEATHTSSNRYERNAAQQLTKAYQKIHPKTEYLRASQQPKDETLLRAAQNTDDTPRDQLLRPSENDEK